MGNDHGQWASSPYSTHNPGKENEEDNEEEEDDDDHEEEESKELTNYRSVEMAMRVESSRGESSMRVSKAGWLAGSG